MIGHFLATLTPEQEDRVLTNSLRPGQYSFKPSKGGCLIGVALDICELHIFAMPPRWWWKVAPSSASYSVEESYDSLCRRFGSVRINAAIRQRILQQRIYRALHQPKELTPCHSSP